MSGIAQAPGLVLPHSRPVASSQGRVALHFASVAGDVPGAVGRAAADEEPNQVSALAIYDISSTTLY